MAVKTDKLVKGLKKGAHQITEFATSLQGIVLEAGVIAAAYKAIDIAGAFEQQLNRAKLIFGAFADDVIQQSNDMATAFGAPRKEFIQGAAELGTLLKAEGYTQEGAAYMSSAFVTAAVNASRFTGIPLEEYLQKIGGALAGHARGLHTIGIIMNDDTIKAEALRLGLMKQGGELTDVAKKQATASLLMKGLTDNSGQLGSNVSKVADLMASFAGRVQNLADSIATMLMPLIGPGGEVQIGLQALQMLVDDYGEAWGKSTAESVYGANTQAGAIGFIQQAVGVLANSWQVLGISFKAVQTTVTFGLAVMFEYFERWGAWIDYVGKQFGKDFGIHQFFDTIKQELVDLTGKQMNELQDAVNAPWASTKVDQYFAKARNEIAKTRADLANKPFDPLKFKSTTVPPPKGEAKFGKAEEAGSKESANTLLRSIYGGGPAARDAAKTAANTAKMVAILDKIAGSVGFAKGLGVQVQNF